MGKKKKLTNVFAYILVFISQIFAYAVQVLIDSLYSHNLPVMLQSWVLLHAYHFLSDSPLGYHSNHEWSPRLPANKEKEK